jgi:REP element-mobilizing transposase RayT
MSQTHTKLLYHIVFGTKNREPWLSDEARQRIFGYMNGIIRNLDGQSIGINGMADHAHILCQLPPTLTVARAVQAIKANSTSWWRGETRRAAFGWQDEYAAFSVSPTQAGAVGRYVDRQQEHHRVRSFREEYLGFLRKAGVEFDERFF